MTNLDKELLNEAFAIVFANERCPVCDCRYCPPTRCDATTDRVYVVYRGYKTEAEARLLEQEGCEVRWDDRGFLPPHDEI